MTPSQLNSKKSEIKLNDVGGDKIKGRNSMFQKNLGGHYSRFTSLLSQMGRNIKKAEASIKIIFV